MCVWQPSFYNFYPYTKEAPRKKRRQLGRRDSEEAISRAMSKHFGHLPSEVVETHRIQGYLVREIIKIERGKLPPGGRLGAAFWADLAGKLSRGCQGLETLKPAKKDRGINQAPPDPQIYLLVS
jgi:hypothetical protein